MSPEILTTIQRSVDAIEDRLRTELSPAELAAEAGFSPDHFGHVFKAATGMSVGRWITRRRLLHAVWAMSRGMRAIDAALTYGFDTHAGFYKAFRREFGCSPSGYLRSHRACRPARVNLKEETSMMDRKTLARALEAWGMAGERVSPVYYANTGRCSDNVFSVGETHVLRVSGCPGALQRQAALHRALAEHGLAAPVTPTLDGQDVASCGDFDLLLLGRTTGQPVNAMALLETPELARALGEGLARLHAALRACDPLLCQEEDLTATLRTWAAPVAREALGSEGAWIDAWLPRTEALLSGLPVQVIHRDANPDNILMAEGRVTGFVDFDLSRIMPRIYDLCYAATGILSVTYPHAPEAAREKFFPMARALWQGYDAAAPLTAQEKQALPEMVIAIQLICVAAFAGSEKLKQAYETNVRMLRFLREHRE